MRSVIDITPDLSSPQILEQNDYLPFGTKIQNPNHAAIPMNNRWRYACKEAQRFGSLDLSLLDFGARMYDPFTARWTAVDPMAINSITHSPFCYCVNNPMVLIDPFGLDWYLFNEDGDYMYRIEAEGEHRIVFANNYKDKQGKNVLTYEFYNFADPIHDPEDINNGLINKIVKVSENDIMGMLSSQNVFSNSSVSLVYKSTGGNDYDYTFSVLTERYPMYIQSSFDRKQVIRSNALFLPDGERTAHNLMNFGNFLWAVTGYTLGYEENILRDGAHINSLCNPRRNNYFPQLDSKDDQFSITLGANYAKHHHYRNQRKR